MSYSNTTPNYDLPQYVADDKPTYLGDFNQTMLKIDTALKTNATNASSAGSSAESAIAKADTAITTATQAETSASQASTTATQAKNLAESAIDMTDSLQTDVQNLLKFNIHDNIASANIHCYKTGTTTADGTVSSGSNIQIFTNTSNHLIYFKGDILISNLSQEGSKKYDIRFNTSLTLPAPVTIHNLLLSTISNYDGQFNRWFERFIELTINTDGQMKLTFENPYSDEQLINFFPFIINI